MKLDKKMKIAIGVVVVFVLLVTLTQCAIAGGYGNNVTNNYYAADEYITNKSVTTGVSDNDLAEGVATALAAGHHFDYSTTQVQIGLTGAYYDDESAISVGVAKRWKDVDALWHGAYSTSGNDEHGIVAGATWRF